MMIRPRVLIVAACLFLSCVATIDKDDYMPSVITGPESAAIDVKELEDATENGPYSTLNVDKFYVNIDLAVLKSEIETYPFTWIQAQAALSQWAQRVPVRFMIYVENDTTPRLPFLGSPDKIKFPGVIRLRLMDLSELGLKEGLLGLWDSKRERILLDADLLETDEDLAYSVMLHELGHLFGVPHVVGFYESGSTGFLVLPLEENAREYVMYPRSVANQSQSVLSDLEVMIARHHLIHYWTIPGLNHKSSESCQHFLVDEED